MITILIALLTVLNSLCRILFIHLQISHLKKSSQKTRKYLTIRHSIATDEISATEISERKEFACQKK